MSFLHQRTCRAHSMQPTSCPKCRATARWWWDEQKKEEKKEESPSGHRRSEERRERRRVLWGRGHVYDRHELGWGRREWWQQVRACKCLCRFYRNSDLVMMNWSCRETGRFFFSFLSEDSNQSEIETVCRWFVQIRFRQVQKNVLRLGCTGWKAAMFVGHTPGICPAPTAFVRPTIMFILQRSKLFLESSPHAWLGEIPGTLRVMR